MNEIIDDDDEELAPPPAPAPARAAARKASPARPAAKPAARQKSWVVKFLIGSAVAAVVGAAFAKFEILSAKMAMAAVGLQVVALWVYYLTSVDAVPAGKGAAQRDVLGPEIRALRRKTAIRFITGLMIAFLSVAWFQRFDVHGYPLPWKATDPASREFNVAKFRFGDYRTPKDIDHAARLMFPTGTAKAAVDAVLIGSGHAKTRIYDKGMSSIIYCYMFSSSNTRSFLSGVFAWIIGDHEADKLWFVFVRYDMAGRVTGVSGTMQADESGSMSYDQVTPEGTLEAFDNLH